MLSPSRILVGDVRTTLARLTDESVQCVVTSPPYFGLRDYGVEGQIGLEASPDAYVAELVAVFREVRRVLRSDGVLWLNLGDSYTGQGGRTPHQGAMFADRTRGTEYVSRSARASQPGLAPKQRLMIPARVAIALQADGWWLRDEIIWHKPNPMPGSQQDRTTPAHEMIYSLTKSARYYYDINAIKEPIAESSRKRYAQPRALSGEQTGGEKSDAYERNGVTAGSRRPNEIVTSLARKANKQDGAGNRTYTGFNERYFADDTAHGELRHPRSVWTIPTRPFKGAHFATFPPEIPRRCISAGSRPDDVVLDPFSGAGTTGLVARQLGRSYIGVELNPAYAFMSACRISGRAA